MAQWFESRYTVAQKRRTFVVTHTWRNTFECTCDKPRCRHVREVQDRLNPPPQQMRLFTITGITTGRRFR
jgi:hypothetical protein